MSVKRNWIFKLVLIFVAAAWLSLVAASWADAGEGAAEINRSPAGLDSPRTRTTEIVDDEYNFNWLDPEKKIYVLQNRRYRKAGRALLTGMGGIGFSNPYRTVYNLDPRLAYYMTESWGVEVFYTFTLNSENSIYDALVGSAGNTRPVVRQIQSQAGGLLHWVPWYAKINVFNQILYFDWYFAAGLGTMRAQLDQVDRTSGVKSLTDESLFAFYLGSGHQYHVNERFVVRLDFLTGIYRASIGDAAGTQALFSNHSFAAGLGLKL